ncbi:MAG TPA: hypothetical protein PKD26_12365 [Pyrinomonadaceae bacterium]|nr:hypothetical protein [Pyrinomonadaceae bacterium]
MNSEELELSLRTEFESYLKGFLADLRQEVSDFQKSFETEFEKHKAQTDEALRKLVGRFESGFELDQAFNESVIEHLRLSRDEGATITAIAIGEAEKMKAESAPPVEAAYDKLRDAVNEISSKSSQSEILGALVEHASDFAPRGVFFIVKNEQFVGWRGFGSEMSANEETIRSMQLPASADTVLAAAIENLSTTMAGAGTHEDDRLFLDTLGLGNPDRLYAVPLVARGRGVAVLYADYGMAGVALNPEALETLVRVAGLTVELAAAGVQPASVPVTASAPAVAPEPEPAVDEAYAEPEFTAEESETSHAPEFEEFTSAEEVAHPVDEGTEYSESLEEYEAGTEEHRDFAFAEEPTAEVERSFESEPVAEAEVVEAEVETIDPYQTIHNIPAESVREAFVEEAPAVEVERFDAVVAEEVEEVAYFEPVEEVEVIQPAETEVTVEQADEPEFVAADEFPEVIDEPVPSMEAPLTDNGVPMAAAEPIAEVASAQAAKTRFRDRNIDLPIEVPEEERRLHNDARRFARLLVSEIKLYNEQKVADGRQAGDLYDRLREAIDRSRDMYDKRVQQPVAEKFDYFHYELVTSLAEGDDVKLGASYPGSRVAA